MRLIPSNTPTAALRRIFFTLVDATDLNTPKNITVTGEKVTLSMDGTTAASTNDIVKVSGAGVGEYYIELTQAEANQAAGTMVRGWLQPSGCALTKLQAQIGPSTLMGTPDVRVTTFADDSLTGAAIAASAVTKVQAGLASSSALATVASYIDTEVAAILAAVDTEIAAIKAKTDNLPSSPAAVSNIPTATEIRNALLTWEPWAGFALARWFRVVGALQRGVSNGQNGLTPSFTAPDASFSVTGTLDAQGNRTAVVDTASNTP